MGAFSELALDIEHRKEKRPEWAVMLSDQNRPAALWQVLGETKGFYLLKNSKTLEQRLEHCGDCWIIA